MSNTKDDYPEISLKEAFWYWLKLGFISFGGPAGQIAIMHHDLVEKKRWISEKRFLHALNYCMMLPGPEAQQLATYIGWLLHRTWGGIIAGSLFVLPSLVILSILTWIYMAYGHLTVIAGMLYGIKPAVVAIVLFAGYRIGLRVLKKLPLLLISLSAFVAVAIFNVAFPYVVLGAALAGTLLHRFDPSIFQQSPFHRTETTQHPRAIIDDDTPTPTHAQYNSRHLIKLLVVGLGIWLAAIGALGVIVGWNGFLTQLGWFFTKAALLTFGGAYAVLPYINDAAVTVYGWLTPAQMMDGLALGESTPGPLIMLVAFVGFVGGWTHQIFGSDSLLLAGVIAASIATFFTFLPSFLFIFIGGPVVESTQENPHFTAPLTGITAAIVGVILNLALFFAYHIMWPDGWPGEVDWFSAIAAAFALVMLVRVKLGVLPVIGIFALAGISHHFLMM
jgi:chromate transporter